MRLGEGIELNLRDVWFEYTPSKPVIKGVSVSVRGERIGIVGQNGSGKTTLLSILMGFQRPKAGEVMINGINPWTEREKIIKTFNPAFEKARLPYAMKVGEFVKIVGRANGDPEGTSALADELGLSKFESQKVGSLSSGQEQLLWIFSALADSSRIPVLDEPFVHLDLHSYVRVSSVLRRRFRSYILTSHIPEDVELLADSIIVLEQGRVIWYGKVKELQADGEVYDVFINDTVPPLKGILGDFGNILVVRTEGETLKRLMDGGKILGYKRSGVRYVYVKANGGNLH